MASSESRARRATHDARVVVGVIAFRIFDQLKPWPARPAENLPGGASIMLDNIAAGLWGASNRKGCSRDLVAAAPRSPSDDVVTWRVAPRAS